MKAFLAACLLAVAAGSAQARNDTGCAAEIEDALREVNPKHALVGQVADAHCKPWPAGRFIAAVMAFERGESPARRWTAVLALLDETTLKVRHSRRFELEEDAITRVGRWSFRLDTANYTLAPGVRALGLRYENSGPGPSAADASFGDELMLFVPQGQGFRSVLGMSMTRARGVNGCLRSCPDAITESADFTIALGAVGPKGWRDLHVTATVKRDGPDGDDTIDRTPKRQLLRYRYDGAAYRPYAGQFSWDDSCCTLGR